MVFWGQKIWERMSQEWGWISLRWAKAIFVALLKLELFTNKHNLEHLHMTLDTFDDFFLNVSYFQKFSTNFNSVWHAQGGSTSQQQGVILELHLIYFGWEQSFSTTGGGVDMTSDSGTWLQTLFSRKKTNNIFSFTLGALIFGVKVDPSPLSHHTKSQGPKYNRKKVMAKRRKCLKSEALFVPLAFQIPAK